MKDTNIVNTTFTDWETVIWFFDQAKQLQGKDGYKVWTHVDEDRLLEDIVKGLQFKIVRGNDILCLFSIQWSDPLIWRKRDQLDALYLHRIVRHPQFRGQRQFETILNWAIQLAKSRGLRFIRLDTWADNQKIIDYYESFGFSFIESYKTPDDAELPAQNRNLFVALLELPIDLL